ncbi:hypothetical protein Ddc_13337 [Ditylenchus destructor]|nr:hypothetical protein Ddc_13337 [Ditylenchus destructor]
MSAFSIEEMIESFKFLPRYTLDGLLLVCRQWNHLIRRFERQLCVHRVDVCISIRSKYTRASIRTANIPHIKQRKWFSHDHPEIQTICLEGTHYELLSFLDSHIRNSVVSLDVLELVPPGVMCLIKNLIEGQIQRNCTISTIYHFTGKIVLVREISLAELLKVSFLSANKSFSILNPIRELNEVGPFTTLLPFWRIIISANRLPYPVQDPDLDIFKNSRRDDWPDHILVESCCRNTVTMAHCVDNKHIDYFQAFKELERQDLLLEYIWPNANGICPDLRNRSMEIVHPNAEDGRRLTIEYRKNTDEFSVEICSFIFKTV